MCCRTTEAITADTADDRRHTVADVPRDETPRCTAGLGASSGGLAAYAGRRRPIELSLAVVLAFSLTAASCGDKPTGISVGEVGRGTVDEIVEAPGSVTARAAATVSAP